MPRIRKYKCSECNFTMPSGWGGHMYVADNSGKRHICRHPGEYADVMKVLEITTEDLDNDNEGYVHSLIKERTGFNTECVCYDCLHKFRMDLERDLKICPKCNSVNSLSIFDLVGRICPSCRKGIIEMIETGIIS